jgi:hypothetical protein
MIQFETRTGSRVVIATSNGEGCGWSSRLYVNGGETATLTAAKHKSEAGARKWAAKILAAL